MRFHVLGLGPIGTLLSHHLRRAIPAEHTITLIHKTAGKVQEALAAGNAIHVERHGVLTSATGFRSEAFDRDSSHTDPMPRVASQTPKTPDGSTQPQAEEHNPESIIESLFITTKAHHTVSAVRQLLPRMSANTTIVLLQNGMGVYEQLVSTLFHNSFQRPHFILASNTHGAWLKGDSSVVHAGIGKIDFAIVPETHSRDFEAGLRENVPEHERRLRLEHITDSADDPMFERYKSLRNTVAALLRLESLDASWKTIASVQVAMQRKLVVNSVINPLTAIMGCRNGELFTTEASRRIMGKICEEAAEIYKVQLQSDTRNRLHLLASQGKNTPVSEMGMGRLPQALTKLSLEQECLRVAELTRGNISSMLSDIQRGRQTEIEYLNGYLIDLGESFRVQVPANSMLLNLVKMRSAIPMDATL